METTTSINDNDQSILKGIRSGAVIRPEPLFHRRTRLIIDTHYNSEHNILRNGVEEIEFDNLKLISLEKLFSNTNEIFLGFGLPNVYLTIPNIEYNGYIKFSAFIFWRQVSAIIPTKGRVQSGFLIRFRDLSKDIIEIIRQTMNKHLNKRYISCAYANACILNDSNFTSGGKDLRNCFGARSLFQQIYEYGLEYQGKTIILDFIRTTSLTLEEHFHQVRIKELTSLGRTYKKIYNECTTKNDKNRAPLIQVTENEIRPIIQSNINTLVRLEISHPKQFGAIFRKIWGSHTLFKIIPNKDKININNYLPIILQPFPIKNPDLITKIKKYFLFSRFIVSILRKHLAALWDDHHEFTFQSLISMASVYTKDQPHIYNIVITGNHLIGMYTNLSIINWLLSKHVLISDYDDDVRFAGEFWVEHQPDGTIVHISNNSGTYKPSNEQLDKAALFLSQAFPGLNIQTHQNLLEVSSSSSPSSSPDSNRIFTFQNFLIILFAFLFWLSFILFGYFN